MRLPLSVAIELGQRLEPAVLQEYERLLGLASDGIFWAPVPSEHTQRYLQDDPTGVRKELLRQGLIQRDNYWDANLFSVRLPVPSITIT